MTIQSTQSICSSVTQVPHTAAPSSDSASSNAALASVAPPAKLKIPADRVDLSAAGRELAARLGAYVATPPGLSAERIRELVGRMSSGYYSEPAPEQQDIASEMSGGPRVMSQA